MVFLLLSAICFGGSFCKLPHLGLNGDDAAMLAPMISEPFSDVFHRLMNLFLHSWEMRPLRVVEHALLYAGYTVFGLSGFFAVQALGLVTIATVFYYLLRLKLPPSLSTWPAALLLLYPADTSFNMAVTLNGRLGVLWALLAVIFLIKGRKAAAGIMVLITLLTYEFAITLIPIALFLLNGKWRKRFQIVSIVLVPSVLLYGFWRFFLAPLYMQDVRANILAAKSVKGILFHTFTHWYQVPWILLGDAQTTRFSKFPSFIMLLKEKEVLIGMMAGVIALGCLMGWIHRFLTKEVKTDLPIQLSKIGEQGGLAMQVSKESIQLGWMFLTGFVLMCLPSVFAVWCRAQTGLINDTRFNFVYSFGAVMVLTAMIFAIGWWLRKKLLHRMIFFALVGTYLFLLFGVRVALMQDYVWAWETEKRIYTQLLRELPEASDGDQILLEVGDETFDQRRAAYTLGGPYARWDHEAVLRLLYNANPKLNFGKGAAIVEDKKAVEVIPLSLDWQRPCPYILSTDRLHWFYWKDNTLSARLLPSKPRERALSDPSDSRLEKARTIFTNQT